MSTWEDFEIECTDYLNRTFGKFATFKHQGGADSTVADIFVKTNSGTSFYIDAKHSPAQCGQFVLIPNLETNSFEYSSLNANRINCYAEKIMKYMNSDFDSFREAGTTGKDILMLDSSSIFSEWIIQAYQEKNVRYFITNGYTILPIEHFQRYFEVTAKYRIKRSGSGNVGNSRLSSVIDYLDKNDYIISDSRIDGNKLFVASPQRLHNERFILRGIEYMFSLRGKEYELRKLSNTYNANVIFSIKKKSNAAGLSDDEFIDSLTE